MEIKDMDLKQLISSTYNLAKEGYIQKELYVPLIKAMEPFVNISNKKDDNPFGKMLSLEMENLREKIKNVSDDPLTRIGFWTDYMKWAVWTTLRNDGIGHLKNFKINNYSITCDVYIEMKIHRDELKETKEDFEKRKIEYNQYLEEQKLDLKEGKRTSILLDTKHNKEYLEKYIKNFCEPISINYTIKDGYIIQMSFIIGKNGKFEFYKENISKEKQTKNLTTIQLEQILKATKEWYMSIDFKEQTNTSKLSAKYADTANEFAEIIYHSLCEMFEIDNDFNKKYNETRLVNKQLNLETRKKEEQIGSTYNTQELFYLLSSSKNNIEQFLKYNYCFYLEEIDFGDSKILSFKWNSYNYHLVKSVYEKEEIPKEDNININHIEEIFDFYYDENTEESFIYANEKNIKVIENLSRELFCEIVNFEISYKYSIRYISKINVRILNIENFIKKFM